MEVKRAVFDIDNTLVGDNSGDAPTPDFQQAAAQMVSQGRQVGLQSARGGDKVIVPVLQPLIKTAGGVKGLELHGLANGAQVYDAEHDVIRVQRGVPAAIAQDFAAYFREHGIAHWINDSHGLENADYIWRGGQTYARPKNLWLPGVADNMVEVPNYEPNAPLVVVADEVPEHLYGDLHDFAVSFADQNVRELIYKHDEEKGTYKLFFLHKEANKRAVLETIADLSGIALEHTVTCGDGANDFDMIHASVSAGGLGFAMGNAADSLKQAATHVLPSQAEDGAAIGLRYALRHFAHGAK